MNVSRGDRVRLGAVAAATVALLGCSGASLRAEEPSPAKALSSADLEWGDLSGRIVVEGESPKSDYAARFADVCGDVVVFDDSLRIAQDGGLADVFVWLDEAPAAIPPDREAESRLPVRLAIDGCRIQPHAAVVRTGQTLTFRNLDEVAHVPRVETFVNASEGSLLSPAAGVLAGRSLDRTFERGERSPCPVRCAIHPWMSAYVLPVEHPYAAVTDATGRFRIEKLPVGQHRFRIWHERTGWLSGTFESENADATPVGERGRFVGRVEVGENDLETLRLQASDLGVR